MKELSDVQLRYLNEICQYLKEFTDSLYKKDYGELGEIFYYHLGLNDPVNKQGKRIRPVLTLICSTGADVPYMKAMPAAAAIELIHNFSLIHDDIEDNDFIRRGKEAVWKKWGLAQGLNAGDAMFNSAFSVIQKLNDNFSTTIVYDATKLLSDTCEKLTKGQYLDIGFENRDDVTISEYFQMVEGKTAALLACSSEMGAILGGLDKNQREIYHLYGRSLGIAFQIYDDWLGIWGDEEKTGKSTTGDLLERKKSLPILLGLEKSERFRKKFNQIDLSEAETRLLTLWLREDGIEDLVIKYFSEWTRRSIEFIEKMESADKEKQFLLEITNKLLMRTR